MDPDPSLLFLDTTVHPIEIVESLPFTYINRFADVDDEIRRRVYYVARAVCFAGRVDLVKKLINGGYVGVNEVFCIRTTLLGVANTTETVDLLIHFFSHPEFIYREEYMKLAIDVGTIKHYDSDSEYIVELLKRKRDRQYAVITMSALADRYRTDVYIDLTLLVESFL